MILKTGFNKIDPKTGDNVTKNDKGNYPREEGRFTAELKRRLRNDLIPPEHLVPILIAENEALIAEIATLNAMYKW